MRWAVILSPLSMKIGRVLFIAATAASAHFVFAGTEQIASSAQRFDTEPPSFELAVESAYLFGVFNPPRNYEINADFLTARLRWGNHLDSTGIFRGYNQIYFSVLAEPIIRGIEDHYFGMNIGVRYNFVRSGSRLVPYFSGGVGVGLINTHPEQFGAQGQDLTFNILTAAGVSYRFSEHFSAQLGLLYQHFSNAGQTEPNPSLNLLGPQLGFIVVF
jgi:hypothetical protein